ncbi:MAG TPA: hypothetical protein PKG77_08660, partial [Phycisphaerae bacterium]|nr:hypothetical protein [Phycisphaerae bacterium]HQL76369.1 hypothetical protein [Phycisphaerae bacterium]
FVKLVKRNKAVSVSIAAAAVILLAVGVFSYIRITRERNVAISERQVAQEQREAAVAARQKERETALAAARRFAMQAIRAAEGGRMDEAGRRARDADEVALNSPWGIYARAMFASVKHDYKTAAEGFRAALKIDPNHAESAAGLAEATSMTGNLEEAAALVPNLESIDDWRALTRAGQTLYKAERLKECVPILKRGLDLLRKQNDTAVVNRNKVLAETQEMYDHAAAKLACEGFEERIKNLPPEEQVKRVEAKLSEINGREVRLKNVKVENGVWTEVGIERHPHVRFLYPLKGLQLQKLFLRMIPVRDLTPLRGMPLRAFHCIQFGVKAEEELRDITSLKGMELEELRLEHTQVSDLTVVKGMRLFVLDIGESCVSDLSPLEGMPLREFRFGSCRRIKDFGVLKTLPLEKVDCSSMAMKDLEIFRGCHLASLNCAQNPLTSGLGALKGMPLEFLNISSSGVPDLEPLRGMPLKHLYLRETLVSDLSPLEGMPLEEIHLAPWKITKGMDTLRSIRTLRTVGVQHNASVSDPFTADDFWREHDRGGFGFSMLNVTILIPTSQDVPQTWRYTMQKPPENWTQPDFDSSGWSEGPGGFGATAAYIVYPGAKIQTDWQTSDIWLIREFTLSRLPSGRVGALICHDEDTEVYINGKLAYTARGYATGYCAFPVSSEAASALKAGRNVLAVHCRNREGGQFVDVGIVEAPPAPASAPASQPTGK